jgi:hypothetical protein
MPQRHWLVKKRAVNQTMRRFPENWKIRMADLR